VGVDAEARRGAERASIRPCVASPRSIPVEMPQDKYRALRVVADGDVYLSADPSGVFAHPVDGQQA
jgi:hypothetical protein